MPTIKKSLIMDIKFFLILITIVFFISCNNLKNEKQRPNILIAVSDDHSWPHASAYGCKYVKTPAFDEIAKNGLLFNNAYAAAPTGSPSRAALLTGKNIWELQEAGTHNSIFPSGLVTFVDILEAAGYHVGYTGKGWAPGLWKTGGKKRNPAGYAYNQKKNKNVPAKGIQKNDYTENFKAFLEARNNQTPFCFWYGATTPHRSFEYKSGISSGKNVSEVTIPGFLPKHNIIKNDLLDYALEIEWFDKHLHKIINHLKEINEFNNTLIIVVSDNGMAFPRAKANLYEAGTHIPMAICWPKKIKGNRTIEDMVSLIDIAPTIIEATNVKNKETYSGRSLLPIFTSNKQGLIDSTDNYVLTGRERYAAVRINNLGYPARAINTRNFLYIINYKTNRWPAGPPASGFNDIDSDSLSSEGQYAGTKKYMIDDPDIVTRRLFDVATQKRPPEELFDKRKDPHCMKNAAYLPYYKSTKYHLHEKLLKLLDEQKDPRMLDNGNIFESYPCFDNNIKRLKGFNEPGKYNPHYMTKGQKKSGTNLLKQWKKQQ